MSKALTLLLIAILVLSSLVMVGSVFAQSVPKPSVPEFTVELVDHSYVVPETTSIDPYTGKKIVNPSYKVENKTIEIIIKNQLFTPPDSFTNLYYNVRVKGNFEQDWTELYKISNNTSQNTLRMQSASENTVISIPQDYPSGGLVDFQVQAVIATAIPFDYTNFGYWTWEASNWSGTQTLTISEYQTLTFNQELIIGTAIAAVVVVSCLVLLYRIKRK